MELRLTLLKMKSPKPFTFNFTWPQLESLVFSMIVSIVHLKIYMRAIEWCGTAIDCTHFLCGYLRWVLHLSRRSPTSNELKAFKRFIFAVFCLPPASFCTCITIITANDAIVSNTQMHSPNLINWKWANFDLVWRCVYFSFVFMLPSKINVVVRAYTHTTHDTNARRKQVKRGKNRTFQFSQH